MPSRGVNSDGFETRGYGAGDAPKELGLRVRAITEAERAQKPGRAAGRRIRCPRGGVARMVLKREGVARVNHPNNSVHERERLRRRNGRGSLGEQRGENSMPPRGNGSDNFETRVSDVGAAPKGLGLQS